MLRTSNTNDCKYYLRYLFEAVKNFDQPRIKLYLQKVDNPGMTVDNSGRTLLHHAIEKCNIEIIQHLINKGCNVNALDKTGDTPLLLAIKSSNIFICDLLLKNNADVLIRDKDETSSLHYAAFKYMDNGLDDLNTYKGIMEMFFMKLNADYSTDKNRISQLILNEFAIVKLACLIFGNEELTKYLLANDESLVNYCYSLTDDLTPLHYAIIFKRFTNAKILIERGADVNALNKYSHSPLYYYSDQNILVDTSEVLKSLIIRRKYITLKEIERLITRGSKNTVKIVLQSGIRIPATFEHEKSLLHLLAMNVDAEAIEVLDELSIKFDLNARDKDGATALYCAARYRHLKQVEYLLELGADVNLNLNSGKTVLDAATRPISLYSDEHLILRQTAVKIVQHLLFHGVNIQDFKKYFSAADRMPMKYIISHLALQEKITHADNNNSTPIDLASSSQNHYESCLQQLDEMKSYEVYGSVTLFHLLSVKLEELLPYARNQEFMLEFDTIVKSKSDFESHYIDMLQWRMTRATEKIQAALVVEKLTGLCSDVYHVIVYEILKYLNIRDLKILCKVGDRCFV